MKTCILYSGWYNAPNGASSFIKSFVQNKSYFNDKIELDIISKECIKYKDFSDKQSIKKRNKFRFGINKVIKHSTLLSILYNYFVEERHMRQIVKYFMSTGRVYDIIHCQELNTAYYLYKYNPDIASKVLLTLHTNGEDFSMIYESKPALNTWLGRKYLYRRLNYVLKKINKIGFVSINSMEIFAKNHPSFRSDNLFYVHNGISDSEIADEPKDNKGIINFICVGTLSDRKNQRSLIEALMLLSKDELKRIKLTLVGDGVIRQELQAYASSNNLANVDFVGSTTNVKYYLNKADVFILASKDEGLPISIIEAMRAGLPIIGSNIAGIPEQIIDNETGLIIECDINSIAQSYKTILSKSRMQLNSMGYKSRELFKERFTLNGMFDNYIKIYRGI